MKVFYEPLVIAFSMYSKIPMPSISWTDRNMRYTYLFFPLVGAVVSGSLAVLFILSSETGIASIFLGAVATAIPILITGGIHMDGFCDTCDGLSSHQDSDEKLRIMKDPNVGAFALIDVCLLMIMQLAGYTQLFLAPGYIGLVLVGFVLSRCLAAYSVLKLPCAKKTGLAVAFSENADKKIVRRGLLLFMFLGSGFMLWLHPLQGAGLLLLIGVFYAGFRKIALKEFGGITGDLAGFCIQLVELICLVYAALWGGITG